MPDRPETEPVDSVDEGYGEAQPASPADVERSREQEELLGSSPSQDSDRSLTGRTHPRPTEFPDDPVSPEEPD